MNTWSLNCLHAMVNPHVCPEVNESHWNLDSDTKTTAHCMKSSLQSYRWLHSIKE